MKTSNSHIKIACRLAIYAFFFLTCLTGRGQEVEDVLPVWKYLPEAKPLLYKYLVGESITRLNQRQELVAKYKSKQDWQKRQNHAVQAYGQILGKFPQKTPLNPVVTGTLEHDGVKVEKIYFESMPGYFVTAALFLPANAKGKLPAIVFCSGHSRSGFRSRGYLHSILNFAKKGFAVLAFDPVGQGERRQFLDNDKRKVFGPTQDHSYPGNQVFLTGRSPAFYFIWDGIRAVDYLYSRPEIDTARIGVTGRSGGGTQTAYIAAFDKRIKAAAPECYVTSFDKLLMTQGPQDAEQNFAGSIGQGLDMADLLLCYAPKPLLIVSTTRDIFNIQGARDVFNEAKKAYSFLGSAGNVNMVEDDAEHASTRSNQEATYAFFQKHLANPGSSKTEETTPFKDDELNVTPAGNVYASLKGDNLQTLAKSYAAELEKKRQTISGLDDLRKRIAKVTGFTPEQNKTSPLFSGKYKRKAYDVEAYLVKVPAGYLPVYWLKPRTAVNSKKIVLLLSEAGKLEAIKEGGIADSLALAGSEVVVPDLSGFGELSNGFIKGGDSWVDKIPFNLWYAGILLNKSPLAVRMKEISIVLDWIKQTHAQVDGMATGVLATDLLHTAVMRAQDFHSVVCVDPLISFQSVIDGADYQTKYISSAVAGMMAQYDVYHLASLLSTQKPVLLIKPRNGMGEIMEKSELTNRYKVVLNGRLQADYGNESFQKVNQWFQYK